MTRIVPNRLGEPRYEDAARWADRYPDEYWHTEDADRREGHWAFTWTVIWIAAAVVTVYALFVGGLVWWS